MIEGLVVVAFLIGILVFMTKDIVGYVASGKNGSPRSFSGSDNGTGTLRNFLAGLVAVVALAGMAERGTDLGLALSGVAGVLALLTVSITISAAWSGVVGWILSIFGLIMAVPAVTGLATGSAACAAPGASGTGGRIATGALFVILFGLGAAATAWSAKKVPSIGGVAVFGALEVIAYMNSPLGYDLVSGEAELATGVILILGIIGSCLLGFAVIRTPELVLGSAAVVILIGVMAGGQLCGSGISITTVTSMTVVYVVVFGLAIFVRNRFSSRG